jgi:preprotein translocase subunit YajC
MNPTLSLLLLQTPPATTTTPPGAPESAPPGGVMQQIFGGMFFPLILCFGVFWFLILRPEQKNRKKRAAMLAAIQKGDKVMTSSGLFGQVVQVQDQVVTLQVADGVRMRFALSAIQSVEDEGPQTVADPKPT